MDTTRPILKFIWVKKLLLICYMATLWQLSLTAQNHKIDFDKIDILDGLAQNSVQTIFQDKIGFLWFGTTDGLSRYNGQNFKNFIAEVGNRSTLSNNVIYSICEDKNNNLYIGTEDGLNIFDRKKQSFERIYRDTSKKTTLPSNTINTIMTCKDNLWIGTKKGLVVYNIASKKFSKFSEYCNTPNKLDTALILDIHQDKNNNCWIATYKQGIFEFDFKTKKLKQHLILDKKEYAYLNNTIYKILEDSSNIWMATNNGVAKLNLQTKETSRYLYSESPSTLQNSVFFYDIIKTSDGKIWAGSGDFGMYEYDIEADMFTPVSIRNSESGRLSGNSYISMLEDSSGVLWLGTVNEGVLRINLKKKPFNWLPSIEGDKESLIDKSISDIIEDSRHNLWIATEQGISIWDRKKNSFKHLAPSKKNKNSIQSNSVLSLLEDSKKNIWIGTSEGLDYLDTKTKQFKHYSTDFSRENQLPENEIIILKEDTLGQIWAGTSNGLCKFNYQKGLFINYFHSEKDTNSLPSNLIWGLHFDSKKRMWVATESGIARYNPQTDNFDRFPLSKTDNKSKTQEETFMVVEDNEGKLWCGTALLGIVCIDPDSGKTKQFPILEKFGTNTVYSLKNYKKHIWFASVRGIGRLDKTTGEIIVFDNKDGIKSNEFNFPSIITHDSLLLFGGTNGITYFKPENIKLDCYEPPIVFTNLKINFKEILPGATYKKRVPLTENINSVPLIKLDYNDNVFSITFSSLDYKIEKKIEYAYKIESINKEWVELGNENTINFTGMQPGEYRLIVKATNSDGVWNSNYRSLNIYIKPPWWKTTWFISALVAVFIFSIIFIIKLRERRLNEAKIKLKLNVEERTKEIEAQKEEIEAQKELIEKQNKELHHHTLHLEDEIEKRHADLIIARDKAEESDRLKSAFLSNMSHEVRTPLNAVIGFSDLLSDHEDLPREEQIKFIEIIKNNSNDLLNLFDKLMDISVIQSKKLRLNKTNFNPNKVLQDLYFSYNQKQQLKSKGVLLLQYMDINDADFKIYSDPDRLKQVIGYLINNAIKYTEKGRIDFGYYKKNGNLEFFVKDTGVGIPKEQMQTLFNQFGKLERKNDKLYRGTGLGLTISKELVELMGGKIRVESEVNQGTNFYFTIPNKRTGNLGIETE